MMHVNFFMITPDSNHYYCSIVYVVFNVVVCFHCIVKRLMIKYPEFYQHCFGKKGLPVYECVCLCMDGCV